MGKVTTYQITIVTKNRLLKALLWPVATYGSKSWTYKQDSERRTESFERCHIGSYSIVSWVQKQSNESFLRTIGNIYTNEVLPSLMNEIKLRNGHVLRTKGKWARERLDHGMCTRIALTKTKTLIKNGYKTSWTGRDLA